MAANWATIAMCVPAICQFSWVLVSPTGIAGIVWPVVGLVFVWGTEGAARGSQPVVVQTRLGSWTVRKRKTGRVFATLLVGSEGSWEECDGDCWFDQGVFYTSVHPALVGFERYSCRTSGACKSLWSTHESSDDG